MAGRDRTAPLRDPNEQPAGRPPPTEVPRHWAGRPLAESRWLLEYWRLWLDPVLYTVGLPRGDGRPVLLLPGFLAGDQTVSVMAAWLRALGYRPHFGSFVVNVDCSDRTIDRLERRVEELYAASGRRVALIGHSRGGHFARALGARRPDLVSHAVSMGSDLQAMFGISSPTRFAVGIARRTVGALDPTRSPTCFRRGCECGFVRDFARDFPTDRVRLTSLYSRGDGVVHWQRAIVPEAECIEVEGSHVGMIANRKCYREIAMALAQPELTLDAAAPA